jgi:hypothetical protein
MVKNIPLYVKLLRIWYVNIYGRDVTEQKKSQAELNRLSLVASTNVNAVILQHLMALSIGPMKVL